MAILIPNMKMPDNCFECPCGYDNMYCRILEKNFWDDDYADIDVCERRLPDCPLVDAETIFDIVREAAEPPKQEDAKKELNIWYEYNMWLAKTRAETREKEETK